MNSFGVLKTKIEKLLEKSYGKPEFKDNLKGFKKHILKTKIYLKLIFYMMNYLQTKD